MHGLNGIFWGQLSVSVVQVTIEEWRALFDEVLPRRLGWAGMHDLIAELCWLADAEVCHNSLKLC